MKPTRPINVTGNPNWQYRSSARTDIALTFARLRRENKEKAEREKQNAAPTNVAPIKRKS